MKRWKTSGRIFWLILCLAIGSVLNASLAQAVYQCGSYTDDCFCGMSNPYPCCDNNCDGDVADSVDGNCAWWAWQQACCNWGDGLPKWGHPKDWASNAQPDYPVSSTPTANTVACRASGTYGHTAWVVEVSGSQVRVSEMNCWNTNGGPCDKDGGMRYKWYDKGFFDGGYIYPKGAIQAPSVENTGATDISENAATLNAKITNDGGASVDVDERRFSWGKTSECSDGWTSDVIVYGNTFSYRLTGLEPDTKYYFQAWAHNSAGWGKSSNVVETGFTTESQTQPPSIPNLISPGFYSEPGEEIGTLTPTFRWGSVPNTDYYRLYISKYPYGSGNLMYSNENIQGTSLALPGGILQDSVKYRWNMKACNDAGCSGYSDRLYFRVAVTSQDRVKGIDVSEYQGNIDWSAVYSSGYRFAFARASLGDENPPTLIDDNFETNMINGPAAGMLMGAYHFAYPDYGTEAASEARHFLNVAGGYLIEGYLRPVLDLERGGSMGKTALSNWVHEWMDTVKAETGIEPIIYVNSNYASNYLDSSVTKYDLWIAHWTYDPSASPNTGIWGSWDFWQYSDQGSVLGISGDVDLDLFNGDMARLQSFVITSTPECTSGPCCDTSQGKFKPSGFQPDGYTDDTDGFCSASPVFETPCLNSPTGICHILTRDYYCNGGDADAHVSYDMKDTCGTCEYCSDNKLTCDNYPMGTSCSSGKECDGEGNCQVILEGDVNRDCTINIFDLAAVGLCYGQSAIGECQSADVTGDGTVNIFDLATVGLNYGKSC